MMVGYGLLGIRNGSTASPRTQARSGGSEAHDPRIRIQISILHRKVAEVTKERRALLVRSDEVSGKLVSILIYSMSDIEAPEIPPLIFEKNKLFSASLCDLCVSAVDIFTSPPLKQPASA
jgi:hypothetical protein